MADRYYSNADEGQRFQPGTTAESGAVDQKFDEVAAGFQQVATDTDRALKLPDEAASQELSETALQRRNKVVGFDAEGKLSLTGGFTWRGDWTTEREYFVNDVFRDTATKNLYVVQERHTSGTLADDITAGKNELAINVADVEAAKDAAEAARDTTLTARDTTLTARDTTLAARDKAEQWAEEPEDSTVEPGAYSALHHRAKAEDAQGLSEQARDASQTAQGLSEQARDASQSARDLSEQYRDTALAHRNDAQTARDKAESWADEAEDVEVEVGKYSARHWAEKAAGIVSDGVIDDSQTSASLTWSSQKIDTELGLRDSEIADKRDTTDTSFPRYDLASAATTEVLDLAQSNVFRVDASTARTLSFANEPGADRAMTVVVHINGNSAVTWPSGISWASDTAPELGDNWTVATLLWTGNEWTGGVGASA